MKDQLVGMFLVVESTGHEHYRTGHIAAAGRQLLHWRQRGRLRLFHLVELDEVAVHARGAEPHL